MKFNRYGLLVAVVALTAGSALAEPFPSNSSTAKPNVAYTYTAQSPGGTSNVSFVVPTPPTGKYYASFAANFTAMGSPSSPEIFSCLINHDSHIAAQSTYTSTANSGWNPAVSAATVFSVGTATSITASCGTLDGTAWTWGDLPLTVSLIRVDSQVTGHLASPDAVSTSALPAGSHISGTTR
jgi:hypothetical protein